MPASPHRLVAASLAAVVIACASAAFIQLLPRLRLGGAVEGVQWVQAAGSMFWALPVTVFGLAGAAALYAISRAVTPRSRMLTSALVGSGAVIGVGTFIAVGTPWYDLVDGVAAESLLLGAVVFAVCSGLYLIASARRVA